MIIHVTCTVIFFFYFTKKKNDVVADAFEVSSYVKTVLYHLQLNISFLVADERQYCCCTAITKVLYSLLIENNNFLLLCY